MLGIIKGDIRYEALAKMLPSVLSGELYDFIGIDTLLLPFGGIDEYYNIKQSKLNLLDILKENDIWVLKGTQIEKLFLMTRWEEEDAQRYRQRTTGIGRAGQEVEEPG